MKGYTGDFLPTKECLTYTTHCKILEHWNANFGIFQFYTAYDYFPFLVHFFMQDNIYTQTWMKDAKNNINKY